MPLPPDYAPLLRQLGYEPGPPPDWLEAPLRAVLRDFQAARPVDIEVIGYAVERPTPGFGVLFLSVEGAETGVVGVRTAARGAELLVELADKLTDEFPELATTWAEPRPECPGHPHPAMPELIGDEAWWVCPRDERRIKPIGA